MSEKTSEEWEREGREREEKLKKIPLFHPTPATWPDTVRGIGIDELSNFGIDKKRKIYWNGKAIVFETRLALSFWQKMLALLAVLATVATISDGLIGAQKWACDMKYWAYCPPMAFVGK